MKRIVSLFALVGYSLVGVNLAQAQDAQGVVPPATTDAAKPPEPAAPVKRTALKYAPPKNTGAATRLDGDGGSRGSDDKMPSLYVLAPNHTALTTQGQPSLFWFQSDRADAMFELTLIEPKNPKPLLKASSKVKGGIPGINRLPLSKYNVTLQTGVIYKWSIAFVPDPKNRSKDVIASGTIERVQPDAAFAAEITKPDADKILLFAGAGYWYDALEALSDEIAKKPDEKELRNLRADLLEQVALKEAAAAERK